MFGSVGVVMVGISVWYSPDGTTRSRTHHDAAFAGEWNGPMTGVAVGDAAVVAVGADGEGYTDASPAQIRDSRTVENGYGQERRLCGRPHLPAEDSQMAKVMDDTTLKDSDTPSASRR